MSSPSVVCPKCGHEIEVSHALTHSIEEKLSKQLEEGYRKRLQEAETGGREKALGELAPALEDLRSQLKEKDRKLKESATIELQLRREKETLEERASQIELEVARKVEEERGKITAAVEARKEQEYKLKETDREREVHDLHGQIETMKEQEELLRKQATRAEERVKERIADAERRAIERGRDESVPAMEELRNQLQEQEKKLTEFATMEVQLRKEKKALEERTAHIELEVARKIEEERGRISAAFEARKEEEYRLRDTDRERRIEDLQGQVKTLTMHEDDLRKQATEMAERVGERIAEAERQASEKARGEVLSELEATTRQLTEQQQKVKDLTSREIRLLKEKRDLEEKAEQLDLEVARKIDEERKGIASEVAARKDEEYRLREAEKEQKIIGLVKQIDDLKRRAEQGSQQAQGEVQELELEKVLRTEFPYDSLAEISKGVRGADCMQEVFTAGGQSCGKVLWESKRTKNWNNAWVDKLKEDQREAKADIAVIVSQVLPEGLRHVGHLGGIWVCDFASAVGMAYILRAALIQISLARASVVGKNEKMEMLYEYLSGAEFRHAVQAVLEAFNQMKEDLESERRATERQWVKREKQANKAIVNMARMYGGIQGTLGKVLPTIPALELPEGKPE